jgi:hypothetical protein
MLKISIKFFKSVKSKTVTKIYQFLLTFQTNLLEILTEFYQNLEM